MKDKERMEWVGTPQTSDHAFEQLYLNEWYEPSIPNALRGLAEEYHVRTEQFNRGACTGPIRRGSICPANAREIGVINEFARGLRRELQALALDQGFRPASLRKAIQYVGSYFNLEEYLSTTGKP